MSEAHYFTDGAVPALGRAKVSRGVAAVGLKKVLYILPPTGVYAGVERVVDEVCAELARAYRGVFEVDVLLLSPFKDCDFEGRPYTVIRRDAHGMAQVLGAVRAAVMAGDYDLVVVTQVEPTVLYWLASMGTRAKFVLYLHGNPGIERSAPKARILFTLMQLMVLRNLAGVFGVAPQQLKAFKALLPSDLPHCWTPNPVRRFADTTPRRTGGGVTFVNVGRFSRQKGQDILLRAFAKVHAARPDARLRIVGYGPDEVHILAEIDRLGLTGAAWIEHHPVDPQPALAASDVYVSSSRWEGWPLVICEALRFGLPVIAADCDFGPGDILTDVRLGCLAPNEDADALADIMLRYCDDTQASFADYRKEYIDRFSVENIVHAHAAALKQLIA
jgi:glycosyltransferase involved in cell wall biosynthesis